MNKLLKYKFLPRQKHLSLSYIITKLVEEFVPALHYKYVFSNFKQTSLNRTYDPKVVPSYLQGRPKAVILHSLHRKAKAMKFSESDITEKDAIGGIFIVKGKNKDHNINLTAPSCTCKDWASHHMPCKHFFAIFRFKENWEWSKLSTDYLNSPFLSTDTTAITKKLQLEQPSKALCEMPVHMLHIINIVVAIANNVEETDNNDVSNADICTWETLPSKVCRNF